MTKAKTITAKEFDARAEAGEDMAEFFDADTGTKRFNVDMPIKALRELDAEAARLGVARQALVKLWLGERLDEVRRERAAESDRTAAKRA